MRPSAFTSTSDTAGQNPPTQPAVDECLQTASHAIRTRDVPPARPRDSLSARSTGATAIEAKTHQRRSWSH